MTLPHGMTPEAMARHRLLIAYFGRTLDVDPYDSVLLEGRDTPQPATMLCYLALYRDPAGTYEYYWVATAPDAPAIKACLEAALRIDLARDAKTGYTYMMGGGSPEVLEALFTRVAVGALGGHDLPLAFLAWMRTLQTQEGVLWFYTPRNVPADMMLARLQRTARA